MFVSKKNLGLNAEIKLDVSGMTSSYGGTMSQRIDFYAHIIILKDESGVKSLFLMFLNFTADV